MAELLSSYYAFDAKNEHQTAITYAFFPRTQVTAMVVS